MKTSYLKFFFSIFFLAFLSHSTYAQYSLDEIRVAEGFDTRLLGINDAGFLCGYYKLFNETGFVITPSGKAINFEAPTGFTNIRVVAINNRDTPVVVIKASNSTSLNDLATVFKAYYTPQNDSFGAWTEIANLGITNPNPTGINNLNQIIGWYSVGPSVNQARYLWIYFDSLATMPANYSSQYYATRFTVGTSPQPTFANGINDNGKICGYFYRLLSSSYESYTFDIATKTFTNFPNVSNRMLHGINDAGFVVGGLTLGANDRSFMGTYSANTLSSIPIPIFSSGLSIQSEFIDVNNNEDIIGNYKHPNSGEWVSFIYRKNTNEFRLPGFDFNRHTWKMGNNMDLNSPPDDTVIWTENYYGDIDYQVSDPYINQNIPLYENYYIKKGDYIDPATSISWKGFCKESDPLNYPELLISEPFKNSYYQHFVKTEMLEKYFTYLNYEVNFNSSNGLYALYSEFSGYCYGFTYTALQKLYDSTTYKDWFGYTQNLDAGLSNNSDKQALLSIERSQLKQMDFDVYNKYQFSNINAVPISLGTYRLKSEFQKSFEKTNPPGIAFKILVKDTNGIFKSAGTHQVVAYKIKTPQHLPFNYPNQQYDTLFLYDSNFPGDSTRYIRVKNDLAVTDQNHDSIYSIGYNLNSIAKLSELNLNNPGVKDLPEMYGHKQISQLKPTDLNDDKPIYTFSIAGSKNYIIKNNTGDSSSRLGNKWINNIDKLSAKIPADAPPIPRGLLYDTALSAKVIVSGYQENGFMNWSTFNNTWIMTISRHVQDSTEKDYGETKHRYWAYGNPDNVTKNLSLQFVQTDKNGLLGVKYVLQDFEAKKDDSIITSTPERYAYKVVRIGGDPLDYKLSAFIWENNAMKSTETIIPMEGNTTHVFDPYYNGPNGHQLVIYVDNGNDGNYNDTIFLASTGINEILNADYISIYPNPASSEINIHLKKDLNARFDFTLTDNLGRVVLSQALQLKNGSVSIPISALSNGLYIAQIRQDGKIVYREKMVKR